MISVHPMTPCMTPDVPRRVDRVMRVVAGRRIAGVIVWVLLGIWCMRAGMAKGWRGWVSWYLMRKGVTGFLATV